MDELIAFLDARLAEAGAVARRNVGIGPGWQHGLGDNEDHGPNWPDYQTFDGDEITAANEYIDHFRPLRALREVEAKRRLIGRYRAALAARQDEYDPTLAALYGQVCDEAAVYSDHPDYRAEWKP